MLIGLTGTIGSGKSTVSTMLLELGADVIDADVIAHDFVFVGGVVLEEIRAAFGDTILNKQAGLDREKMAELVFADAGKRKVLESIIHPHVATAMRDQIEELQEKAQRNSEQDSQLIVLDVPLLFEAGMQGLVQRVVVVSVSEEQRFVRLLERSGLSEEQINSRLESQWSQDRKRALADDHIDNSGSIEETREQVGLLYAKWLSNKV